MPFYMHQGRYTQGAIKNLVQNPEDRSEVVAAAIKAAGGTLHSWFMCFGDYDYVVMSEFPSDEAALAAALGTASVGHVADVKTTRLFTGTEAKKAMAAASAQAKSLTPPKGK
jgi:uncharacterized protein with GYD domain